MASDGAAQDAVAAKLQKQLEYYFSDANLRRDAHLKSLAGADNDSTLRHWVDLEHVLAFSRARAILNELPTHLSPMQLAVTTYPTCEHNFKTIPHRRRQAS